MKKLLLVAWIALAMNAFSAESEGRHSFKIGTGFSGHANGSGIDLDISSPSLFEIRSQNGKARTHFSLYLEAGDEWVTNFYQSAGVFKTVHNGMLGAGIRMQSAIAEATAILSPYSEIGAEAFILSALLSSKRVDFGFRVGFGCDLFFIRSVDGWLGTSDSSFFVEGNLYFFHGKMDAIAGSPSLREGLAPRIGMRSHF